MFGQPSVCVAEVDSLAACSPAPADSIFGPLHLTHALRKLDRTKEARQVLFGIAHKFPKEWRIFYALACYCSKLGQQKRVMKWLMMAIDVAGKQGIRAQAFDEADFENLWREVSKI